MSSKNADVVDLLQAIGDLMELRGDEQYRVRAYREAARQLDLITEDVEALHTEKRLTDVRGVGPSIARTIGEFLETGRSRQLDELRAAVPESLVELLGLRHFGPSRIVKAHRALGITNLDELEAAARDGRLAAVPTFGARSAELVLASIERFRQRRGLVPRYIAESTAAVVVHSLRQMASLDQVAVVGAIRRLADATRAVDVLAASRDVQAVVEAFGRLSAIRDVKPLGPWEAAGTTRERLGVRLLVVHPDLWAQGLWLTTGSEAHTAQLRERAQAIGLGIAEPGTAEGDGPPVWPGMLLETDGTPLAARDEETLYRRLGLPLIPPELREGRGEIAAGLAGRLPHLVTLDNVRGDLHLHTSWSDGRHTVEEMARAALALGRSYIAVADHSPSLGVARGLTLERLAQQREEIARTDAALAGIRILSGVELDIKRDGSLDYPDEVLARFDFVTASIHSGFQQPGQQLTQRVIDAMRSPHVDAIGHLTGRVLGWRDGLELDVEAILAAAAETNTAMEINAWPNRLDLNEEHARRAKELGVKLVINTDSHAADQLEYMHYGVEIARRAWLEPDDILNTRSVDALQAYLASRPHKT